MTSVTATPSGARLTLRMAMIATGLSLLYLLLAALLIGFKTDQVVLVLLFNGLFYLSGATRRFVLAFTVFIVFWVLFDSMKAFPNYRYNTVHIRSLYELEKSLFGITGSNGMRLTPNEFLRAHRHLLPDILAGCFYLCWIPLPLAFAGYLYYRDKVAYFRFSLTFLTVNLLGFVIYYAYPAAPPWYVEQVGFVFHPNTPGNTAGLGRWDDYFHVRVFAGLYSKSSNVFAAMPSLHAAYPLTVLYYGIRYRLGWWNALFALIMAGIWFVAVYSGHHYVLDVLAGIATGVCGIALFNFGFGHVGWFRGLIKRWAGLISGNLASVEPDR